MKSWMPVICKCAGIFFFFKGTEYLFWLKLVSYVILWLIIRNIHIVFICIKGIELLKPLEFPKWWKQKRCLLSCLDVIFGKLLDNLASQVALVVKNLPANAGDARDSGSIPGLGRSPWRRKWQPTPVFLPGESHGQGSLVGYSPWRHKESDMAEAT